METTTAGLSFALTGFSMNSDLKRVARTWQDLGEHDPLWAVASHAEKRGGRWQLDEFMQTGEDDIARYHALILKHSPGQGRFSSVLDFGCGAGRLTAAWGRRAESATGVDISEPMLGLARKNLAACQNLRFVLNESGDLRAFADNSFDLVFSLICLQHIPWPLASNYIREFGRVCRRDGIVGFQLPSHAAPLSWMCRLRRRIVDRLPFGLDRKYRQWRHGSPVVFDMHYTAPAEVESVARSAGLSLLHREPDASAGADTEGFFYIFLKPSK